MIMQAAAQAPSDLIIPVAYAQTFADAGEAMPDSAMFALARLSVFAPPRRNRA
jgi:hypothetical protein